MGDSMKAITLVKTENKTKVLVVTQRILYMIPPKDLREELKRKFVVSEQSLNTVEEFLANSCATLRLEEKQ